MELLTEAIQIRLEMHQYKIEMHFPHQIISLQTLQIATVPRPGQQHQEDHLDQSMIWRYQ